MDTVSFIAASLFPEFVLILRHFALRNLSRLQSICIDLALLIVSLPIGMELVGWAANFPVNPGDHSPGIGVAWALLFVVWFICLLVWLVRLAAHGFEALDRRER